MPWGLAIDVHRLGQVDDHQPLLGGQQVERRQVAVGQPEPGPAPASRRSAAPSSSRSRSRSGRVWASRGAPVPSARVMSSIRISVPSSCTG